MKVEGNVQNSQYENDIKERNLLKTKGIDFSILIQERAPWGDFNDEITEKDFERKPPTIEKRKIMDQEIKELGELFADSDIKWFLDGALNISLMSGNYIGVHKDIDISVEKYELEKLEKYLLNKGYGMFVSLDNEEDKIIMKRVSYKNFVKSSYGCPHIARIDEHGDIIGGNIFGCIDVHITERNRDGFPLGVSNVVLPKSWFDPYPIDFQGSKINLEHPVALLYFKLHQTRNYDKTDIQKLIAMKKIKVEDIDEIESIFTNEFIANKQLGHDIFENILKEIDSNMDSSQIYKILMQRPEFKRRKEQSLILSQRIFESRDKSLDIILKIAMNLFDVENSNNKIILELNKLREKLIRTQG